MRENSFGQPKTEFTHSTDESRIALIERAWITHASRITRMNHWHFTHVSRMSTFLCVIHTRYMRKCLCERALTINSFWYHISKNNDMSPLWISKYDHVSVYYIKSNLLLFSLSGYRWAKIGVNCSLCNIQNHDCISQITVVTYNYFWIYDIRMSWLSFSRSFSKIQLLWSQRNEPP